MAVHEGPGPGLGASSLGDGATRGAGDALNASRFDAGKPPIHLVAPSILTAIATVSKMGADKYGERNWEKGFPASKVYSPLMRHLIAWWEGEDFDAESGLPHLYHIAWNIHVLVEQERRIKLGSLPSSADDRPKFMVPGYDPSTARRDLPGMVDQILSIEEAAALGQVPSIITPVPQDGYRQGELSAATNEGTK